MPTGTTGAIRQGRAFVELFTDDTKLKQGLRRAESSLRRFGASISRIGTGLMIAGAAMIAPLAAAAKLFSSFGDTMAKMALRTGFSVEALSELKFAVDRSGGKVADLEKGIRKMQQTIYYAGYGMKTYERLLQDVGLSYDVLKNMKPEDQFTAIATKLAGVADKTKQAAIATLLFGRAGTGLLPMFEEGADGLQNLREKARELGLTMSTADAAAAATFTDSMYDLIAAAKMAAFRVGAALAPAIMQLGDWIKKVIPNLNQFVQEHKGWIILSAKAALYAIGLGAALFALGKTIALVGGAFAALRIAVSVMAGVWAVLTSGVAILTFFKGVILGVTAAFAAARAAVLGFGSATAIAQAIVAIWPAIFLGALGALLYLTGGFSEMGSVFKQAWGGISDAIAAGDIETALKIMWAGIRLIWTEGCNYVADFFSSMLTGVLQILTLIGGAILVGVMGLTQGIHWLWTELWTRIANGWTETWSRLKTAIIAAKNWLGIMSDSEASAAIKAEIQIRTKTISGRQDTRAAAHAADAQRVEDAKQAIAIGMADLQKWNQANVDAHDAETERRRQDLADLVATAKAKKEAMMVNPEAGPTGTMPAMDFAGIGGADRANAVVGGFDIGAIMSFQAGASDSKLERIAKATEESAESLAEIAETGNESTYGG